MATDETTDDQAELEGMPDPASRLYLSGGVGAPEGLLKGIGKAQIGQERTLTIRVEIKEVGDQKQRQGRASFVRFHLVEAVDLSK
jgi:hypothetical protein